MALEDVLKANEKFQKGYELAEAFRKNSGDPSVIDNLYNVQALTPEERDGLDTQTPFQLGRKIVRNRKKSEIGLAESVEKNYEAVLNHLDAGALYSVLSQISPIKTGNEEHDKIAKKHEKMVEMLQGIKEQRYDVYFADLKERDEEAYETLSQLGSKNPEMLKNIASSRLNQLEQELMITLSKGSEDKKELDTAKMREYVRETIGKYEKDDKPSAYLALGRAVEKKK